ncbi:MAG: hypothetical protein F9K16_12940 [Thermoanaerobaculia bacterium]|nr:MAG: hypothetical protein F9K16_12940 [Thermoanaerobaculia bacterium]
MKTGFNAEAASAARFRALAARAAREGRPNVASRLTEMAVEKDALALAQYEAVEAIREPHEDLPATVAAAVAEERYENDALYPRMIREVDDETAGILREVVSRQQEHARRLSALLDAITGSTGDIPA